MRSDQATYGAAGILTLDHVAFGVPSIAGVCAPLAHEFGATPHHAGPGIGFRGAQWEVGGGGRIEAIEPSGEPGGFLHRFLAAGGPRVHHLTFKVEDIRRAAAAAESAGFRVVGFSEAFASWKEMFLHPKEAQGVVVQLAESHPELEDDGWSSEWPFPRIDVGGGTYPRVLGLRLRSRSGQRALRQWSDLLGGEARDADTGLCIEWVGSPLRLSIEIDAAAEEGPLGLEIAAEYGDSLTPRRLDALGCDLLPTPVSLSRSA